MSFISFPNFSHQAKLARHTKHPVRNYSILTGITVLGIAAACGCGYYWWRKGYAKKTDDATGEHNAATGEAADEPTNEPITVLHVPQKKPGEKPQKSGSTARPITTDDLTKIIVRKIKQSKANNERIGLVLKTYGVERVSDLKPEQYEAFITDLAAL